MPPVAAACEGSLLSCSGPGAVQERYSRGAFERIRLSGCFIPAYDTLVPLRTASFYMLFNWSDSRVSMYDYCESSQEGPVNSIDERRDGTAAGWWWDIGVWTPGALAVPPCPGGCGDVRAR